MSADEGIGGQFADGHREQNLVAVTVNVDAERGVANQIAPGDHVDIATTLAGAEGGEPATEYFLRNVKVLAVGAATTLQQRPSHRPSTPRVASRHPPAAPGSSPSRSRSDERAARDRGQQRTSKLYLVLLPPHRFD